MVEAYCAESYNANCYLDLAVKVVITYDFAFVISYWLTFATALIAMPVQFSLRNIIFQICLCTCKQKPDIQLQI
jgi:hypothetical protein